MLTRQLTRFAPVLFNGGSSLTAQVQALFAGGKVGGMWDKGDIATLFQDAATPVTTVGQPIGMVLDKSQGLVRGVELISNGSFDTDTIWSKGTGWSITGGAATSVGANQFQALTQTTATISGKTYEVSFVVSRTSGSLLFRLGSGANKADISASGSYRYVVQADGGSIAFLSNATGFEFVGTIDNVSVKELPGNHATQSTAIKRPLYQVVDSYGCAQFDGTNDLLQVSGINLSATNKVLIGLAFKPNTSALSVAMEYSTTAVSNIGAFYVSLNESGTGKHVMTANSGAPGLVDAVTLSSAVALAPTVLIDYIDLTQLVSTAKHSVRVNGASAGITSVIDSSDVAGNFGNYDLFLGARSGSSWPSNMNLYRAFVLAGSSTAGEQLILENWLRESCGV